MISKSALGHDGETARDLGMAIAANDQPDRVVLGRLALLDALLASDGGTGTIDDATSEAELAGEFGCGGQWRGSVTRSLASSGLIERIGYRPSNRPSRHRAPIAVWRLRDRKEALAVRSRLVAALKAHANGPADSPAEP